MRINVVALISIPFALLLATVPAHSLVLEPEYQNQDLIEAVVKITKRRHFVQVELDDRLSGQIFDAYLDALDPTKSHFTQQDIAELGRWRLLMDDQLEDGKQTAAFAIYNRFLERATQRINTYLDLLVEADLMDFNSQQILELDPEKRSVPATDQALRDLWRLQVKNQILNLLVADQTLEEAQATLQRRFKAQLNRFERTRPMDVVTSYLNAYATMFDHTLCSMGLANRKTLTSI